MDQHETQQYPSKGSPYVSGPPSGSPMPGGMLPNGQPPRPNFMSPQPPNAQMGFQQAPPVNGMSHSSQPMPQRPTMQQYPPQSYGLPKVDNPQANYPQQRPPGYQQQPGFGPPSQHNGPQSFHPSQNFPQPGQNMPPGVYASGPMNSPHSQMRPSLPNQNLASMNRPPSRGSPLPPFAPTGSSTPRDNFLLPPPRGFLELPQRNATDSPMSEPVSACSSRNPSPLPAPRYDQMEGQFPAGQHQNSGFTPYSPTYNGSHSSSPLPPLLTPQPTSLPPQSTSSQSLPPASIPSQPAAPIPPISSAAQMLPPPPLVSNVPSNQAGLPPMMKPLSSQQQNPTSQPPLNQMSEQQFPGPSHPSGMPPTSMSQQQYLPPTRPPVGMVPQPHQQHVASTSQPSGMPLHQQYPTSQPTGMPPLPHQHQPPISQPTGMPPFPHQHQPPILQPTGMPPLPHQHQPPISQPTGMPPLPHQHQPPTSQPIGMPPMPQQQYPTSHQPMGMPPMPQANVPRMLPAPQEQTSHMSKRYPNQAGYNQPRLTQPTSNNMDSLNAQMGNLSVTQTGFSKLWGMDTYDLMQTRNILPPEKIPAPKINLHQTLMESANCSPEIFRCTLTKVPESNSLLQKSRLPLGILIHPFKDLSVSGIQLPVIQCNTIVRCRACRTYINPFVYFVDHRRWKCNLCYRVNELPEEFQYDPVTKTYGDPSRRPEIKSATIEFIAPSEYMLRPPQPAVYLFVLEVSRAAIHSGYLNIVCETLVEELDKLPGDSRTQIGFLTFDSALHFYGLSESYSQPRMMVVGDIDDVFLPWADNLLVNLQECRDIVRDLLNQLPLKFAETHETGSALGAALQASFKLMAAMGGRVTIFQVSLPSSGPGALQTRGPGNAKDSSPLLNPATDFYKRLALDCSGQQIAVDLFLLNSQYADLATLSGISRFSGGCIHHFPDFNGANTLQAESLERCFRRYLNRKIGFEAVMRVRCTRGLAIHTFHGNFFVRSTDLLSLPNVNPDAGFGMQLSIEENLSDVQNVCFQAALLYTSSKGERRIRVHTMCLPIAANVNDILNSADQQCIVGLLAKMAVDRSQLSSLSDARDAFINVAVDVLSTYRISQSTGPPSGLLAPHSLRLLPLYIVSLLKHPAFRSGQNVRVDDRLFAMCQMKSLPLDLLMQCVYPDLYPVHYLTDEGSIEVNGQVIPQPPRCHLSAEKLDSRGLFLLDRGDYLLLYAGRNLSPEVCQTVLGVPSFQAIPEDMMDLPELKTPESERLRSFVSYLQSEKPYPPTLQVIREDSKHRGRFIQHLIEDRSESALSYYEFLQHLKTQVK